MSKRCSDRDDPVGEVRRSFVAPTEEVDQRPFEGTVRRHPAFGAVTVSRVSVGGYKRGARLFGSDVGHHTLMRLTVHKARQFRDVGHDRHMADEVLCEFEMSEAQWVSLIASQGVGMGVPVTLCAYRDGAYIPCPQIAEPAASRKEEHGEEMARKLKVALSDMNDVAKRIADIVSKPGAVAKTELRDLSELLTRRVEQAPGGVQFVYDQFAEVTETMVERAKVEFEAFVMGTATHLGLDQMRASGALPAPELPSLKGDSDDHR